MVSEIVIVSATLCAAFIAALAQYLFKRSMPKISLNPRSLFLLIKDKGIVLGALLYLVSLVIYLYALRHGELSFVYPTFASAFVFVFLMSHFVLKEGISRRRALGMAAIIAGIIIVAVTY
jgi:uncharacterized membrane protein